MGGTWAVPTGLNVDGAYAAARGRCRWGGQSALEPGCRIPAGVHPAALAGVGEGWVAADGLGRVVRVCMRVCMMEG